MCDKVYDEIVEILLSSISQESGKGLMHSFMYGKPGSPHWQQSLGAKIYYETDKLTLVALLVRRQGPNYLKALDLNDIRSALRNFVSSNYWHLGDEVLFCRSNGTYAEIVSAESKREFADALASSSIFKPNENITLFPLVTISIETEYYSEAFSLIKLKDSSFSNILPNVNINLLCPDRFPPLSDWKGKKEIPSAWLGVSSPSIQSSKKIKAAILGCQGQSKIRPCGRRKSLPVWLSLNDLIKGPIGPFMRLSFSSYFCLALL